MGGRQPHGPDAGADVAPIIEFFRAGTIVNGREHTSFSVFTFIAAVYFICCFSLSRLGSGSASARA